MIDSILRLRAAKTSDEILDALWDLRDSAYDHPQSWHALTAEALFQALAETVAEAPTDDRGWFAVNHLLAHALEKVLAPGSPEGIGM